MIPLHNPRLADLPFYTTAKPAPTLAVRLASNENPYGPSPRVLEALARGLTSLQRYPEPSASWLRDRIANHHGLGSEQVLVGNGATEILNLVAQALLGPGENTIDLAPSFVMYRIASMMMGAEVREVPPAERRQDLSAIAARVDDRTKLVYLANPNNPTGTYVDAASLRAFVADLPPQVVVVIDEAYREYAIAPDFPDAIELLGLRERLAVVRTFSKCHGLAALRAGYVIAPEPLIACLDRARLPFNVNAMAQIAAAAALDDTAHVLDCQRRNREEMERLVPELTRLGCAVTPSQANFLLVDLRHPAVVADLAQSGVLIRSMAPYGLPTSARITIGTRQENQALIDALEHVHARRP